jgi:hypothetical protein
MPVIPFAPNSALEKVVSIVIQRLTAYTLRGAQDMKRGPDSKLDSNLEFLV